MVAIFFKIHNNYVGMMFLLFLNLLALLLPHLEQDHFLYISSFWYNFFFREKDLCLREIFVLFLAAKDAGKVCTETWETPLYMYVYFSKNLKSNRNSRNKATVTLCLCEQNLIRRPTRRKGASSTTPSCTPFYSKSLNHYFKGTLLKPWIF